jgi:hypothetical protein
VPLGPLRRNDATLPATRDKVRPSKPATYRRASTLATLVGAVVITVRLRARLAVQAREACANPVPARDGCRARTDITISRSGDERSGATELERANAHAHTVVDSGTAMARQRRTLASVMIVPGAAIPAGGLPCLRR